VTVEAAYSKHRRRDVQPIRREFAEMMMEFVKGRPTRARLFPMPSKPVEMLPVDLAAAGIAYEDSDGHFADFHISTAHLHRPARPVERRPGCRSEAGSAFDDHLDDGLLRARPVYARNADYQELCPELLEIVTLVDAVRGCGHD